MVKTIVVAETITSGVIWRVNVNQFDLSVELLFEGVECNEIVAFDDEVFANDAVLIALALDKDRNLRRQRLNL